MTKLKMIFDVFVDAFYACFFFAIVAEEAQFFINFRGCGHVSRVEPIEMNSIKSEVRRIC